MSKYFWAIVYLAHNYWVVRKVRAAKDLNLINEIKNLNLLRFNFPSKSARTFRTTNNKWFQFPLNHKMTLIPNWFKLYFLDVFPMRSLRGVEYTMFDKDDELRFRETCKTARRRREETSFLRNWDFPRLHIAARCKAMSVSALRTWKRKGVKTRSNFSGHWVRRLPSV